VALLLSLAPRADAFPLDTAQQKCAGGFTKSSVKVLGISGKESVRCHSAIGKSGGGGSDDVATCFALDEKSKLATAAGKVDAAVDKYCEALPYPMTCPVPCETTDDAGATTDIDDAAELKACLACFNPAVGGVGIDPDPLRRGIYGAALKDVTIPSDSAAVKCQSGILKSLGKLVQTKLKIATKCIKAAYDDGALAPPDSCISDLTADSQVGAAFAKLSSAVFKCTPPPPFDNAVCVGLDGSALAECLDQIAECRTCRFLNGMMGGTLDCDTFDNGAVDASCLVP
jgi:hypothetical protein